MTQPAFLSPASRLSFGRLAAASRRSLPGWATHPSFKKSSAPNPVTFARSCATRSTPVRVSSKSLVRATVRNRPRWMPSMVGHPTLSSSSFTPDRRKKRRGCSSQEKLAPGTRRWSFSAFRATPRTPTLPGTRPSAALYSSPTATNGKRWPSLLRIHQRHRPGA